MTQYIAVNSNNLITSFVWSGLLDKAKCGELLEIIKQCSVEIAPIEVLQEIRQEINQKGRDKFSLKDEYEHYLKGLTDCLDIIDSHISAISRKSISDRDCEHCKHRHPIGCDVWECTFEPRDEDKDEEDNE